MREIKQKVLSGQWHKNTEPLTFSCRKVELICPPGEKAEGVFAVQTEGESPAEGFVSCMEERITLSQPYFQGRKEEVLFSFDGTDLEDGDVREGFFFVLSNAGEYSIPYKINIKEAQITSSMGEIRNLFHFANLARSSFKEAVALFYTNEFINLFKGADEQYRNLYRGLSRTYGNENNVDEFLAAIHKKQPMTISPLTRELTIPDLKGRASEDILIMRNGWGPVRILVETKGDFLTVEKSVLTEEDFLGSQCRITVFLDSECLHGGKNTGSILLKHGHEEFCVPVTVEKRGSHGTVPSRHREISLLTEKLVREYQEFKMKKLSFALWQESTLSLVEKLTQLSGRKAWTRLFKAQLLITGGQYDEASWILGHVEPELDSEKPDEYAYYLYLTTLLHTQEEYVQKVTAKIKDMFRYYKDHWRIAWLLLFLEPEYSERPLEKWQFLMEIFEQGCKSPVLYLEALQLMNNNPAILLALGSVEKRILYYGAKNGYLSRNLAGHLVYLAGKEKYYDDLFLKILKLCYEKWPEDNLLQAICATLIRGGKTGADCFSWYLKGVEKELRVTRLYEFFMLSIDLDKQIEIPRPVLLYFAYQSNLDYEYAAYLYRYVEEHRGESQELYFAYKPRIDRFVVQQLYKKRINRNLAWLYAHVLLTSMMTPDNARALNGILYTWEVICKDDFVSQVVVVHSRIKGEKSYPVRAGKAYIQIFDRDSKVLLEDAENNRQEAEGRCILTPLFDVKKILPIVEPYVQDSLGYHLALCASGREDVAIQENNVLGFRMVSEEKVIHTAYARRIRMGLIRYYFEKEKEEELKRYLSALEPEDIFFHDRIEVVRYQVLSGLYEKAYQWMKGQDPAKQDARILLRLTSRLLEQEQYSEDPFMTALCYSTASRGKYDTQVLCQLVKHYNGSIKEMEALKETAENFSVDTYPMCERLILRMLYCGADITERMELLRQYVQEGGDWQVETAFLERCAEHYVLEEGTIHYSVIQSIIRMMKRSKKISDVCGVALLVYYVHNKDARNKEIDELIARVGEALLDKGICLPVLKEYADIVPGAELLLDKTFVLFEKKRGKSPMLHYRILRRTDINEPYRSKEMPGIFRDICGLSFILFPGESLQYYITWAGEEGIADSGLIAMEQCTENARESRYGMLCEISETKTGDRRGESVELLHRYMYTDWLTEGLFNLL